MEWSPRRGPSGKPPLKYHKKPPPKYHKKHDRKYDQEESSSHKKALSQHASNWDREDAKVGSRRNHASKGCIKQESKATSGVWQKASLEEIVRHRREPLSLLEHQASF
ncbi:hypothetical protein POM88_047833 [Heracleum sosnowskyi]|uniref:Uncharacterized protein n=1 Tax=Heracleum sosnowskyi TaxID=360622 RepID=A0AAD8GSW0_9APIA|nr:hypothetical protein POM88_047833 [Heracleum sosnowskyi]